MDEKPRRPDPAAPAVRCPFCGVDDVEVISLFGSQVMTQQCRCRGCGSFFEASKY
jgi:transcription elongation factor Elf1